MTQTCRSTNHEAALEASLSSDTHWTATLSTIGMTRIARAVVMGADSE